MWMYSRIIARDLRLVASRLYRMGITWPGVTCHCETLVYCVMEYMTVVTLGLL